MKHFSIPSFEKLLFPLHGDIYKGIEKAFSSIENQNPGSIDYLASIYDLVFESATTEFVEAPKSTIKYGIPAFDIYIEIKEQDISRLNKTKNYAIFFVKQDDIRSGKGMHLVIGLNSGQKKSTFIVPAQLILKKFEKRVCRPDSYQVYEHTLIRKNSDEESPKTIENYLKGSASYIGITKRGWNLRFKEHMRASNSGSQLLFHKALRGELFEVDSCEHQVLRAGLSANSALRIEEIEVEKRTLRTIHEDGLNMIPGGTAGMRFMALMTKRNIVNIDPEKKEMVLEEIVNASLRQPGIKNREHYKNDKLAKLWREDIKFRIKSITNRSNRLSYKQILNARLLHASGWTIEKIHECISAMEKRRITIEQIKRLVRGMSYQSIPHVLIDVD